MEYDGIRCVGEYYVTDRVVPTHHQNPFSALDLTTIAYNIDCDTRSLFEQDSQGSKRINPSPGNIWWSRCKPPPLLRVRTDLVIGFGDLVLLELPGRNFLG